MIRKAYLIEIYHYPDTKKAQALEDLAECESLVEAAGHQLAGSEVYNLHQVHPHTCIGPGKLDELESVFKEHEIDLIVIDFDIKPYALKHIEDRFNIEVADRTRIILEIFKQRATSAEGKLQVELAEAMYELGRLAGKGIGKELSRLGGGVGTRGPGEQQTEVSRRAYLRKIKTLRSKLERVEKTREAHYKRRREQGFRLVSLVGYTNAGKSTLLNTLAGAAAGVTARDQLFTTVDPTTRKLYLDGQEVLLTDTVGFIKKLPTELVEGFESTLEQVVLSDLVLLVVDRSDPAYQEKEQHVRRLLKKLHVPAPIITTYNKIDRLSDVGRDKLNPAARCCFIAAATGEGVPELKQQMKDLVT